MVIHPNVVDGRLRFLNRFSGPVNRDLVLLGRLRVLGQTQFLNGVIHLHDVRDDLAASISDLAVTQDQHLDTPLHQIQRRDHFEPVVGMLLGVLLRDFRLVPERFGSWKRLVT